MPSLLRPLLLTSVVSLTVGCSFFFLDDPPEKKSSGAGATGGDSGSGGTTGGTGGSISPSGGVAGTTGGTGGSAMAGTGGSGGSSGAAAGTGNVSGSGGDSSGGGEAGSPGSGGDAPAGGSGSGTAGMPGAGMGGSGGSGPMTCVTLNSGSEAYGGHCYLVVTSAVSWNTAKSACMALGNGAHLVTISNGDPAMKETFDAELAYVFGKAGGKETWIGTTDGGNDKEAGDGTPYTWITSEPNPPSEWGNAYGWADGEPNNYNRNCMDNSSCWEHCGFMLGDQGGKWNDALCEDTKQYVCEWDMGG